MSERDLLRAYQSKDDDMLMEWLMQPSTTAKPSDKQPKPAEQPQAPAPAKPGGFFATVAEGASAGASILGGLTSKLPSMSDLGSGAEALGGEIRKLTGAGSKPSSEPPVEGQPPQDAPGSGILPTLGRGAASVLEEFSEGAKALSTPGAGQPGLIETPVGNVKVPAAMMDAGPKLIGAIQAVFPWSPGGGSISGDFAEHLESKVSDEQLAQAVNAAQQVAELTGMQADRDAATFLTKWYLLPREERLKQANEAGNITGQLMTGFISGYTAVVKGGAKLMGLAAKPAQQATAAAKTARVNAVKAAGETLAVAEAERQTAAAVKAAQPVEQGGPRPPLTLKDLRHGMQPESTPGVKAGPSAPGSIPENMVTLDKLTARARLNMLRTDAAAAQAIDETIPDARTLPPPGAARVAGESTREQLRTANRTSLEGGDLPSTKPETSVTGHPYEKPSEPLDEQAIKMAQEYDAAVTDPAAKPAWDALARETERMYDEIAQKIQIERVQGQPYASAAEMNEDIARGHFKVTDDNSEHPFWDIDQNWKFRVVHDYLGHFEKNHDFSLKGEKDAYLHHVGYLTDPEAKDALQLEIYGQAAANVAHGGEFQPQKAFITKQPFGEVRPPQRITAYHGTSKTFDQYDVDNVYGGSWFAEQSETASKYAMKGEGLEGAAPQVRPVSLTIRNAAPEELYREAIDLMQGDTLLAREALMAKNYDAVAFTGDVSANVTGKGATYLVFDPNKSAVPLYGVAGKPLETAVEAAKRRIAERFGELKQGLTGERGSVDMRGSLTEGWEKNRQLWNDLVTVGAGYIWDGTNAFKDWAAKMVADFGEAIKPQLAELFKGSQAQMKKLKKVSADDIPSVAGALKMLELGEHGGQWYDNAWDEIQRMFGKHAETYAQVLAATSPNTAVKSNVTMANRAMEMIISGERNLENPFKAGGRADGGDGFMQAHADNLNRVLRGEQLGGPKVGPFARALMGDRTAVVVDTWMSRAFGFGDAPSQAQITFIQRAVTSLAEQTGRDARQVQAAIWTGKKIMDEGPSTFVEDISKTIERAIKDTDSPLYEAFGKQLESVKGIGEQGKIQLGTYVVLARTAAFAMAGAATGDSPETSARNMLLSMGIGAVLSPKLAKQIIANMSDPEVRQTIKEAIKLQGEQGSLFPKRPPLKVNESNTGGSTEARALIRGVASRLEKARELSRSHVQTHEDTIAAAMHGRFKTPEDVLGLDEARLSLDELASVKVQVKGIRDFIAEDVIQTAAKAKIDGNDELFEEAVNKSFLLAKVSQKWADLETAGGRFVEASKIKSTTAIASKYDLDEFAGELAEMKKAMVGRGDVNSRQFVEMISSFADRAAAKKLAETASRYPEALWSIYYGLNLMGSPLTHARNMLGNLGGLGMAVADRGFGEIIALPFHAIGRGENMVQPGETYQLAKGIVESIADSFRGGKEMKGAFGFGRDAFKSGESIFSGPGKESEALRVVEATMDQGVGTLPKVIEVMATLARANLRFMGGTDEFFKVLSFNGEIRALAQRTAQGKGLKGQDLLAEVNRLVDSPSTEMLQQAEAFAKENTFTKAFVEGTWGKSIEKAVTHPAARLTVTPFYRTPMRLAEFSTTHTPILNVLAKQTWSDISEGGVKANLAAAKMFTGTAALAAISWFAIHGYITGDPPSDPQLRAAYERVGWKDRSIYIPVLGKYVSYANIEPLSTIVSAAANMVQITRDLDEYDTATLFEAGTIAMGKSILSKQWFSGLSDFFDVIESATRGEDVGVGQEFLHRRLASLIPGASIWRTLNRMTDDERRETKQVIDNENPELREFTKLVGIYTQNVPGWGFLPGTKPRPAMVHMITGEPLANENTWLGALLPIQVSTLRNDPVLKELVALEGAGLPAEIPRVLGGSQPMTRFHNPGDEQRQVREGVILNQEERQRLGVLLTKEVTDGEGRTLHEALRDLIDSDEYADHEDGRHGGKAGLIADMFNEFLDQAKEQLLEEYPQINQIIARRQLERGLMRMPKSMDDLKDFAREALAEQQ